MSRYTPGDVVLVPFPHKGERNAKLRPAIVVALDTKGDPVCCPIRSSPRAGATCVPIGIDEFVTGGLDLFSESYVQTDTVRTLRSRVIVGKKGIVTREFLEQVNSLIRR